MRAQHPVARAPSRRNTSISVNTYGSANRPASQTLSALSSGSVGIQRRPRAFSTVLPSLVENSAEVRPVERDTTVPRTFYGVSTCPSRKSIDVSLETDEFLDYVNNSLRIRDPSSFLAGLDGQDTTLDRVRSSSSSYGSGSGDATKANCTASPPPDNALKERNLLKYSRSGNRLSDLQSSASDSRRDSTTNVVDESAATTGEWQTIPRPRAFDYNRCELIDSQEILPSDSVSQVHVNDSPRTPTPRKTAKPHWFGRYKHAFQPSLDSLPVLKGQYDGGADSVNHRNLDSPHPDVAPPLRAAAIVGAAGQKRKASNISLASISSQTRRGAKKLKVLASSVYRKSAHQISEMKRKLKQQNEKERKRFEAWKANRRRDRPADPLKGKGEPGFGAFTLEQSRHGHKDWWRDGVSRYKAPSWMVFGGQRERAKLEEQKTKEKESIGIA